MGSDLVRRANAEYLESRRFLAAGDVMGSVEAPTGGVPLAGSVSTSTGYRLPDGRVLQKVASTRSVMRLLRDGTRDPNYNDPGTIGNVNGFAVFADGSIIELISRVRIDPIAIGEFDSTLVDLDLRRRDADGVVDQSFGENGSVDLFADQRFHAAAEPIAMPDGSVLIRANGGLAKFDSSGALDNSFGNLGFLKMPSNPERDDRRPLGVATIALDRAGRILVGAAESTTVAILRLTQSGVLDRRFGVDGISKPLTMQSFVKIIQPQEDGSIVLHGFTSDADDLRSAAITRLTPSGKRDDSFGTRGTTQIKHYLDYISDISAHQLTDGSFIVRSAGAFSHVYADGRMNIAFGKVRYPGGHIIERNNGTILINRPGNPWDIVALDGDDPGTISLVDGVLRVHGSDFGDEVDLGSGERELIVGTQSYARYYDLEQVQQAEFDLGGSRDRVTLSTPISFPLVIRAGDGNDSIDLEGAGRPAFVDGGAGDDYIYATPKSDTLDGGDGDDTIMAAGGNDLILGGAGDDTLRGQNGNDTIRAQTGNDVIYGGAGRDWLDGGKDNDRLISDDNERDTLFGGRGGDRAILDSDDAHDGVELPQVA